MQLVVGIPPSPRVGIWRRWQWWMPPLGECSSRSSFSGPLRRRWDVVQTLQVREDEEQ